MVSRPQRSGACEGVGELADGCDLSDALAGVAAGTVWRAADPGRKASRGRAKQAPFRGNRLLPLVDVDVTTDSTDVGSSGSPVLDGQGEPQWTADNGTRVSAMVRDLGARSYDGGRAAPARSLLGEGN